MIQAAQLQGDDDFFYFIIQLFTNSLRIGNSTRCVLSLFTEKSLEKGLIAIIRGSPNGHVLLHLLNSGLRVVLATKDINILALRVHKVKEDGMINKVVLARFKVRWGRKVYSISLASLFNLIISTS